MALQSNERHLNHEKEDLCYKSTPAEKRVVNALQVSRTFTVYLKGKQAYVHKLESTQA
jgi:hypothetical protein